MSHVPQQAYSLSSVWTQEAHPLRGVVFRLPGRRAAAQANGRIQQSAIVLHMPSSAARSCYVEIVEGLHMQFELLRGSRRLVFLLSFELLLWPIGVVLTKF